VANIITVNDQSTLDRQLRNLHLALSSEVPLDPYPYLQKGMWVEVTAGPFRGLQGVIEDRLRADRLLLQVDMLGRAMSLEIEPSLLQVLDRP
jgi:transcription antitermination factor NusG